jgi:predicted ArsR family transcriptional regulator
MARDAKPRTRDKVLLQLKQKGPQAALQLASRIRVTAVAVRQHLYRLSEEGLVAFAAARIESGAPQTPDRGARIRS